MKEIKDLRDLVVKYREEYNQWSEDIKRDCQIQRATKYGEMHNWFVCMGNFHMSFDELGNHWDKIKQDKAYINELTEYNEKYTKYAEKAKELSQAIIENQMEKGKKYFKEQLVLFGFDNNYAITHGL